METKKTKDKGDKAECADFGYIFKGFRGLFEMMNKCCKGQDGPHDCSAMMDSMIKGMMQMCCGPKTEDTKADSTGC